MISAVSSALGSHEKSSELRSTSSSTSTLEIIMTTPVIHENEGKRRFTGVKKGVWPKSRRALRAPPITSPGNISSLQPAMYMYMHMYVRCGQLLQLFIIIIIKMINLLFEWKT